ncbi:hypothetical protein [Metabacillus sp. Hm71]|uniref:hypothetical protein n=1 Tax=Metabacillus sp. Hm71 TaxID=3450743 RepID=UPI003F443E93
MLTEIFTNVMFIRGMPNEKRINQNIESLKATEWFKQLYLKNEELFKKDEDILYVIGWANIEKALSSENKTEKLRTKIINAIKNS